MDPLRRTDERIISLFTKFSNWFQRLTGRTNFFLAKIATIISTLGVMVGIGNWWIPVLHKDSDLLNVIMGGFIVLFSAVILYHCDRSENDALFNSTRLNYFPFLTSSSSIVCAYRILVLALTVLNLSFLLPSALFSPKGFLLFKILDRAVGPAFCAFLYLIIVNPLPPEKSKIREWIEEFSLYFKKLNRVRVKA